jgi:hypothetical protein
MSMCMRGVLSYLVAKISQLNMFERLGTLRHIKADVLSAESNSICV